METDVYYGVGKPDDRRRNNVHLTASAAVTIRTADRRLFVSGEKNPNDWDDWNRSSRGGILSPAFGRKLRFDSPPDTAILSAGNLS